MMTCSVVYYPIEHLGIHVFGYGCLMIIEGRDKGSRQFCMIARDVVLLFVPS
jgi:hypothetical protein